MKQIWPTYAYSPTTNVLTLTGLNIDRDQLLLVTAADRGRIMYNFADSSVTASAFTSGANTALTLVATTAGLTTTAALVIYYDDQLQSTSVSISNFPASQVISGTVTANPTGTQTIAGTVTANLDPNASVIASQIETGIRSYAEDLSNDPLPISGTVTIGSALPAGTNRIGVVTIGAGTVTLGASTSQIGSVTASISGTVPVSISSVTVGNSVTIGSLPAISGTVTANLTINAFTNTQAGIASDDGGGEPNLGIQLGYYDGDYKTVKPSQPLPISGTVTASVFGLEQHTELPALIPVMNFANPIGDSFIGNIVPIQITNQNGTVDGNNPLPISGTVTANSSNGSLTTRFGSVTTANTAFATSAVTNANRKYLLIQNITTASNVITVGIGFTPTTTQGIQLFAGAGLTFEGNYIPTGAVNLLSSVTASCYTILEA